MRIAPLLALALAALPRAATAQPSPLTVQWPTGDRDPVAAIVSLDVDDDNDDGVPDALEQPGPDPARDNEVVAVAVSGAAGGSVRVRTEGGVRVLTAAGLVDDATVPAPGGRATVALVGVAPSRASNDAAVAFSAGAATRRVAITVVSALVLHGDNAPVWAHRDAVAISHEVTNNGTLPRVAAWGETSPDPDNVRVEVWDPGAGRGGSARLVTVGTAASVGLAPGAVRGLLPDLQLGRADDGLPLRSQFVRLVADETDLHAPGVSGQTLLAGLRDRVQVRYRRVTAAGEATSDVRLGRPGNEDGPLAARRGRWHLVVMRDRPGGRPLIGGDDATALRIGREQVAIANEIYLQCMITFGDPATYPVTLADPPQGTLLSVADDNGLVARGGEVRLRAGGRPIGPVRTRPGWRPIETAEAIAAALRAAGFSPRTTLNRRTDYGADGSADIVVRDGRDRLVEMAPLPGAPLTTDPQQSLAIGRVDFADGVDEFHNLNSSSGTLEERTLLKSLTDDDVTTIDLFVVNRFTHQTRIGEAFVEGDGSAIVNALLLDRAGVAAQRDAWTQAHEAGHILLNQPWHPDNMGPDRPWLLMDADASLGAVTGPKRLAAEECQRLTAESGVGATPALLSRYDEVRPSPRAAEFRRWPASELYPRSAAAAPTAPAPARVPARQPDRPARAYGLHID